jgi:PadR family transcriptional regulator PadR
VTESTTDVIQGTLDMLILKTLSLQPMHGYGISRRIEQVSRGVFKVNPGSLLTALHRLERAGWLDSEWRQTDNARRANFYSLTAAGRPPPASSRPRPNPGSDAPRRWRAFSRPRLSSVDLAPLLARLARAEGTHSTA